MLRWSARSHFVTVPATEQPSQILVTGTRLGTSSERQRQRHERRKKKLALLLSGCSCTLITDNLYLVHLHLHLYLVYFTLLTPLDVGHFSHLVLATNTYFNTDDSHLCSTSATCRTRFPVYSLPIYLQGQGFIRVAVVNASATGTTHTTLSPSLIRSNALRVSVRTKPPRPTSIRNRNGCYTYRRRRLSFVYPNTSRACLLCYFFPDLPIDHFALAQYYISFPTHNL